ncbi:Glutathione S-transferase [Homalodisca vitripennis]|nr:Glutathione S-transferase [Homalodisca vitripennis]
MQSKSHQTRGKSQEKDRQHEKVNKTHDKNSKDKQAGVVLYYASGSSPCRAVLMLIKALGIKLNLVELNLMNKEHLKPEFLKINPQHNVPTLDDNGFAINESRAILTYLAEKFGKDDSLYPKDVKKRALVNQRLYFDIGTLYQRFADLYYPIMFFGASFNEENKKKLDDAFGFLDKFLEDSTWVAGDAYTVADYAIAASVSTADIVGYEVDKFKNVAKWFAKCQSNLPGYAEGNKAGLQVFKGMYEALTKNKKA